MDGDISAGSPPRKEKHSSSDVLPYLTEHGRDSLSSMNSDQIDLQNDQDYPRTNAISEKYLNEDKQIVQSSDCEIKNVEVGSLEADTIILKKSSVPKMHVSDNLQKNLDLADTAEKCDKDASKSPLDINFASKLKEADDEKATIEINVVKDSFNEDVVKVVQGSPLNINEISKEVCKQSLLITNNEDMHNKSDNDGHLDDNNCTKIANDIKCYLSRDVGILDAEQKIYVPKHSQLDRESNVTASCIAENKRADIKNSSVNNMTDVEQSFENPDEKVSDFILKQTETVRPTNEKETDVRIKDNVSNDKGSNDNNWKDGDCKMLVDAHQDHNSLQDYSTDDVDTNVNSYSSFTGESNESIKITEDLQFEKDSDNEIRKENIEVYKDDVWNTDEERCSSDDDDMESNIDNDVVDEEDFNKQNKEESKTSNDTLDSTLNVKDNVDLISSNSKTDASEMTETSEADEDAKDKHDNINVKNEVNSSPTSDSIPRTGITGINLETEPAFYKQLTENLYLIDKKKSRASKEVQRMTCECIFDPDDPIFVGCGEDCLNRLLKIECSKRCPCGEFCTNQNFQQGCRHNLTVFNAGNKGWGLRSENRIEKGGFVIEYCGEVVDYEEFRSRTHQYDIEGRTHYYFMTLKSNEVIDATQKGSPSRFINHSCDPNCVTEKWTVNGYLRVGFFALRTIPAGTELSFDYQLQRYGEKAQMCYCGSENCTGIIGGEKQTPLKQVTVDKLASWLPSTGISPKKKGGRKKFIPGDSEGLENELEKILSGKTEISSPTEALDFTRLMVKAKVQYDKIKLLRVLQGSSDQNALKAFIRFKGLALLWSWMIESSDEIVDYKLEILQTLKHIPVQNKNQIEDSRLLQVVTKWSDISNESMITRKSEVDDTIDSNSDTEGKERLINVTKITEETAASDDADKKIDVDEETSDSTADFEKTSDEGDATTSDADKLTEVKCSQLAVMAKDLLDSWKSLKEIFKIPRKSNITSTVTKDKESGTNEETAKAPPADDDNRHSSPAWPALQSDRISKRLEQESSNDSERRFSSPKRSHPRDDDLDWTETKVRRESSYRSEGHRRDSRSREDASTRDSHSRDSADRRDSHSRDGTPTKDDYPPNQSYDYYTPRRSHRSRHDYDREQDDERRSSSNRHNRRWRRDGHHEGHSRDDYDPYGSSLPCDSYSSRIQSRLHQDQGPPVHGNPNINHIPDASYPNQIPPQEQHSLYNQNHPRNIQGDNQSFNYNVSAHHQHPHQNQAAWPPPPPPPAAQPFTPVVSSSQFHTQNAQQTRYAVPPAPPNMIMPVGGGPFSPPSTPYYNQPRPAVMHQVPQQHIPVQQQQINAQGFGAAPIPVNQQYPPLASSTHHQPTLYNEGMIPIQHAAPNVVSYPMQNQVPVQPQQHIQPMAPNMYGGNVIQVAPHQQNQFGAGQIQFSAISMQQGNNVVAPSWSSQPSSTTQVSVNQVAQTSSVHMDINSPSTPEMGPTSSDIPMMTLDQQSGSDSESMDVDTNESPSATEPIPPLPPGWRTATDPEGKIYYYHVESRVTQWEPPVVKHHSADVSTTDETSKKSKNARRKQSQISDSAVQRRGPKTPPISPVSQREEGMRCRKAAADTTVTRVPQSHRRGPHTPPDPSQDGHDNINTRVQKVRDAFKAELSHIIVTCLNPYQKTDCKHARITSHEDFKFLARKLTHGLMMKELSRLKDDLSLTCNDSVKGKVKDYIKVYMRKFHEIYIRS